MDGLSTIEQPGARRAYPARADHDRAWSALAAEIAAATPPEETPAAAPPSAKAS